MRRSILPMLIATTLLLMPVYVVAEAITSSGSSPTLLQLSDVNDSHLAPKITYDSGYKRLHSVASDLTSICGVNIVAGKTEDDWRVRDIPLVVCVKDMPLSKLLQAIADATHCCCIPETDSGNTGKISYRIYRRAAEQAKIDDYMVQARERELNKAKWAWDAMAALGKKITPPGNDQQLWLISKLVSTLDAKAKTRLFSGKAILIHGTDPAQRKTFAQLYKNVWSNMPQYVHLQTQPSQSEIDSATLAFELRDTGYYRSIAICVTMDPLIHGQNVDSWKIEIAPDTLKQYCDSSFPRYPESYIYKGALEISGMSTLPWNTDWDQPYLKAKFDIQKPADTKHPTFADLVQNIARASGCNIVTEDFISNLDYGFVPIHSTFRKNTSVSETLRSLNSLVSERIYTWFSNDNDRLLIGWAGFGFGTHWQEYHAGLLPENYLNSLHSKYDNSGLDLDDLVHLSSITSNIGNGAYNNADSFAMWVGHAIDFWILSNSNISSSGFWRIYDSLSPSNKLLAKSEKGFPLSKLDPTLIEKTLRMCRLGETNDTMLYSWKLEEIRAMMSVLTDPSVISTMVMFIIKSPASEMNDRSTSEDYGVEMDEEEAVKALGLTDYRMLIRYKANGENCEAHLSKLGIAFPARSFERENQLLKTAEKNRGPVEY